VVLVKVRGSLQKLAEKFGTEELFLTVFSLTWTLEGGMWSTPSPGHFTPGKENSTYRIGGWVGTRAGLEECGKSLLLGFDPWIFQPIVIRYSGSTEISILNKNVYYMRFT